MRNNEFSIALVLLSALIHGETLGQEAQHAEFGQHREGLVAEILQMTPAEARKMKVREEVPEQVRLLIEDLLLKYDMMVRGGIEGREALAYFEERHAVNWIAPMLTHRWRRNRAISSLRRMACVEVVPAILDALQFSVDEAIRERNISGELRIVRRVFQRESVAAVEELLMDQDLADESYIFEGRKGAKERRQELKDPDRADRPRVHVSTEEFARRIEDFIDKAREAWENRWPDLLTSVCTNLSFTSWAVEESQPADVFVNRLNNTVTNVPKNIFSDDVMIKMRVAGETRRLDVAILLIRNLAYSWGTETFAASGYTGPVRPASWIPAISMLKRYYGKHAIPLLVYAGIGPEEEWMRKRIALAIREIVSKEEIEELIERFSLKRSSNTNARELAALLETANLEADVFEETAAREKERKEKLRRERKRKSEGG